MVEDAGPGHRVPADPEGEERGGRVDAQRGGIQGDEGVGLLLLGGRQSGRDGAVQGDAGGNGRGGGEEPPGLALEAAEHALADEGIDVPLDAEGAGEAEVGLNLTQRGGDTVLAVVGLDEAEHLLLALGELFVHSVQVDTRVVGKQSRSARGAGDQARGRRRAGRRGSMLR